MGSGGILLQCGCGPCENGSEAVVSGFREAFFFPRIDRNQSLKEDAVGLHSQFDGCGIVQVLQQEAILPAPEVVAGADFQALIERITEDESEGQWAEATGCSWSERLPCGRTAVSRYDKNLCPLSGQFCGADGYGLFEGGAFFPAQVGGDPGMIGGIADILAQRQFSSERKMSFAAEDGCTGFAENANFIRDKQLIFQIITAIMEIFQ